jgi:imidazolonepropionase-like amidohydrolase
MADAARAQLRAGVTTVRDLGDRDYLALRLRDGRSPGPLPTIVAAGPPITTPGGHCHFPGGAASGIDGVRAAVRERAERGVDVIKVMASGGELTPGSRPHDPQFSPAELAALVDEAHLHGLPVTAHAHAVDAIRTVLRAGVDGIEHCTFRTAEGAHAPADVVAAIVSSRTPIGILAGILPGFELPPAVRRQLPRQIVLAPPAARRRCARRRRHRRRRRPAQAARGAAVRGRAAGHLPGGHAGGRAALGDVGRGAGVRPRPPQGPGRARLRRRPARRAG